MRRAHRASSGRAARQRAAGRCRASAPRRKHTQRDNEPRFDRCAPLSALNAGVDITQLPGISPYNGLKLISEVLSSRTRLSANRAAHHFRLAALSVGRSDTALGAFYRRLAARIGKPKALTATARKLAVLFYRLLTGQLTAQNFDASHYEQQQRDRTVRSLRRRAKSLGLQLLDVRTGEVLA